MSSPNPAQRAVAGTCIRGTGLAVPKKVVTNHDLAKQMETSHEWIVQRTGIHQRYISENGERLCALGADAVRQALAASQLEPSDLDMLLCATMTPDMICPATACQIVAEVGAVPCGAMDINLACTGFVAGLNLADSLVRSGFYRHIAVVGAEQLSRIVNWEDRATSVLFGDGAGAAIVSACDDGQRGCIFQMMHSDGSRWSDLYCPRSEKDVPPNAVFNGKCGTLQMNGREVYKFAVSTLQTCIERALTACKLTMDDVRWIVPHQSNTRILASARAKLGIPDEKMYVNLDRYGNTSAASVALCLHELQETEQIQEGDVVIFVALGGGLTWAASVWKM